MAMVAVQDSWHTSTIPDVKARLDGYESWSELPVEEHYDGDAGAGGSGQDEEASVEEDDMVEGAERTVDCPCFRLAHCPR